MVAFLFASLGIAQSAAAQGPADNGSSSWPFKTLSLQNFTTPVTGDLDGDGALEVAFLSYDGNLYVTDVAGRLRWMAPLHDPGFQAPGSIASAALADVDGDAHRTELVAVSGHGQAWGRLHVFDANGSELARFDTPCTIVSSPVVLDSDADGTQEVYFGLAYAPYTYFRVDLTHGGPQILPVVVWSRTFQASDGGCLTPAAAAELFHDGRTHLIVTNGGIPNSDLGGRRIFAIDPADGSVHWSNATTRFNGLSAPVVVDLDGDGRVEVLQASTDGALYVFNGQTGRRRWIYDTPGSGSILHTPVAHDFDGDGRAEIVVAASANPQLSPDFLRLLDHRGNLIWAAAVDETGLGYSSAAVGDIDGDGSFEIVIGTEKRAPPHIGSYIRVHDRHGVLRWKAQQGGTVYSSPSLTDLDGDGTLEILFGIYDYEFSVLDHRGALFTPSPLGAPSRATWPTNHLRPSNNRVH